MRALALAVVLLSLPVEAAETGFSEMLAAAKAGDSMARVVVGYAFHLGEYRDGTPVEQNLEAAYAWASLANYQENPQAQELLNRVIPKLPSKESADTLAGEYFRQYGAERGSHTK